MDGTQPHDHERARSRVPSLELGTGRRAPPARRASPPAARRRDARARAGQQTPGPASCAVVTGHDRYRHPITRRGSLAARAREVGMMRTCSGLVTPWRSPRVAVASCSRPRSLRDRRPPTGDDRGRATSSDQVQSTSRGPTITRAASTCSLQSLHGTSGGGDNTTAVRGGRRPGEVVEIANRVRRPRRRSSRRQTRREPARTAVH